MGRPISCYRRDSATKVWPYRWRHQRRRTKWYSELVIMTSAERLRCIMCRYMPGQMHQSATVEMCTIIIQLIRWFDKLMRWAFISNFHMFCNHQLTIFALPLITRKRNPLVLLRHWARRSYLFIITITFCVIILPSTLWHYLVKTFFEITYFFLHNYIV